MTTWRLWLGYVSNDVCHVWNHVARGYVVLWLQLRRCMLQKESGRQSTPQSQGIFLHKQVLALLCFQMFHPFGRGDEDVDMNPRQNSSSTARSIHIHGFSDDDEENAKDAPPRGPLISELSDEDEDAALSNLGFQSETTCMDYRQKVFYVQPDHIEEPTSPRDSKDDPEVHVEAVHNIFEVEDSGCTHAQSDQDGNTKSKEIHHVS